MKSISKNTHPLLKAMTFALSFAVLMTASPISSFAANVPENSKTTMNTPESGAYVKYLGSDEKKFEFKVEFENPTAQPFTLIVRNDEGEVIFSKDYNDVHFAKTIHLMKEGADLQNIRPTFTISAGSRLIQRSFSIQ